MSKNIGQLAERRPHQCFEKQGTACFWIVGHGQPVAAMIGRTEREKRIVLQPQHSIGAGNKLKIGGKEILRHGQYAPRFSQHPG